MRNSSCGESISRFKSVGFSATADSCIDFAEIIDASIHKDSTFRHPLYRSFQTAPLGGLKHHCRKQQIPEQILCSHRRVCPLVSGSTAPTCMFPDRAEFA